MFSEERKTINEIDAELKRLFLLRQATVLKIAEKKFNANLPIFDGQREMEMKDRLTADLSGEDKAYYLSFLEHIINLSKLKQAQFIEELEKNTKL